VKCCGLITGGKPQLRSKDIASPPSKALEQGRLFTPYHHHVQLSHNRRPQEGCRKFTQLHHIPQSCTEEGLNPSTPYRFPCSPHHQTHPGLWPSPCHDSGHPSQQGSPPDPPNPILAVKSDRKHSEEIHPPSNNPPPPPAQWGKDKAHTSPCTYLAVARSRPPNPSIVVDLANLGDQIAVKPWPNVICRTLNQRSQDITPPQVHLAAIRWTQKV